MSDMRSSRHYCKQQALNFSYRVIVSDRLTLDMPGLSLPKEGSSNVYSENIAPNTFTDLNTDRPYQDLDDHQPGFDCKYHFVHSKPTQV